LAHQLFACDLEAMGLHAHHEDSATDGAQMGHG
jgi:hypothetical protein